MTIKELAKNKVNKKPDCDFKAQIKEEAFELFIAFKDYDRNPTEENRNNICEELSDMFFNLRAYCFKYEIDFNYLDYIAYDKTKTRFPEELE